jgi:thioredoxin 1
MMSELIHVTDDNFETEIINSDVPVLVDFSATWCGPCKQLAPIVEELATEYAGRLKVAHVDVDHARNNAAKFGVMSVPTVLYIKAGTVTDSQVGMTTKAKMIEKIDNML